MNISLYGLSRDRERVTLVWFALCYVIIAPDPRFRRPPPWPVTHRAGCSGLCSLALSPRSAIISSAAASSSSSEEEDALWRSSAARSRRTRTSQRPPRTTSFSIGERCTTNRGGCGWVDGESNSIKGGEADRVVAMMMMMALSERSSFFL